VRITWPGRLLLLGILVAVGWSRIDASQRSAEIDALAAQPACELALDYWRWRNAFERTLPNGITVLEGNVLQRFIDGSRRYRDAISRHETADVLALRTLYVMVRQDASRDAESVADFDVPLRDFQRACPVQASTFASEVQAR